MDRLIEPEYLNSLPLNKTIVNWLYFSPDNKFLVSAAEDSHLFVYVFDNRNSFLKLSGHRGSVSSVAATENTIVSVSKDCTARLWKLVDDSQISWSDSAVYRSHNSPINCVDINSHFNQFSTASDDQTVKIWSLLATNKLVCTLSGEHTNWVRHARFSNHDPHYLSSCGDDGVICIWDVRSRKAASKMTTKPRSHFLTVQWHPTCCHFLSSSSSDSSIRIWDLRNNSKPVQHYQVHENLVTCTDFHPDGRYLISSSKDQRIKIIDIIQAKLICSIKAHYGQVNCVKFSANGEYFASAGSDRTVLLWQSNSQIEKAMHYDEKDLSLSGEEHQMEHQTNHFSTFGMKNQEDLIEFQNNSAAHSLESVESPSSNRMADFFDIVRSILKQLETINETIVNLDERILAIEQHLMCSSH